MIDANKLTRTGARFWRRPAQGVRHARRSVPARERALAPEGAADGVGYDWVDGLPRRRGDGVGWRSPPEPNAFPSTLPPRRYYLLREIFEEHFVTGMENGDCAYATCPFGKSIACSTGGCGVDPREKSVATSPVAPARACTSRPTSSISRATTPTGRCERELLGQGDVGFGGGGERAAARVRRSVKVRRRGAERSQVGFSGARADRVRGFVGMRAVGASAAVAFA